MSHTGPLAALALAVSLGAAPRVLGCLVASDCYLFNPCLVNARCVGGQCRYENRNCSDGNFCTEDLCDPRGVGCYNPPSCPSDGLVCNGEERCSIFVGGCFQGLPPNCDDGNACTIDSCVEPTGCRHVPLNCADANACTQDTCDPATGCRNEPIPGCCRTATDCPVDACTKERRCAGGTCDAGTPISCDDGDPATTDGCDPATGCTHVAAGTTTTTTLPGGGKGSCGGDGDCAPDDDPCTEERCADGRCTASEPAGYERLGCVCRRGLPAACAGEAYPRKLARRTTRACALVARAREAAPKRRARLIGKVGQQFTKAGKLASRAATQEALSAPCAAAVSARMADGVVRATALREGS